MKDKRITFLDLETTGLDPKVHEIIEVGCVLADQSGGTVSKVDEFEMKILPEHIDTADPQALRVNGYTPEDWRDAKDLFTAMTELAARLRGTVLVAQNVTFDHMFLVEAFHKAKISLDDTFYYHKLDLASMAFGKYYQNEKPEKFTMRALCEHFGVDNKIAHTALSDARATYEVFAKLITEQ